MRDNPLQTFIQFLTGQTSDQMALENARWFTVALYWALLLGGLTIASYNWRLDAKQRTLSHIAIFFSRFVLGGMWFQGTLWKLPLPVAEGFKYWMQQSVKFSAFQWHADIMQGFLDHIAIAQPLVYLLEIALTVSLMLGLFVRIFGVIAILFTLNLLISLYNDPTEWPWTYMSIICAHSMFAACQAGRSLGLDHLIVQRLIPVLNAEGTLTRAVRGAVC